VFVCLTTARAYTNHKTDNFCGDAKVEDNSVTKVCRTCCTKIEPCIPGSLRGLEYVIKRDAERKALTMDDLTTNTGEVKNSEIITELNAMKEKNIDNLNAVEERIALRVALEGSKQRSLVMGGLALVTGGIAHMMHKDGEFENAVLSRMVGDASKVLTNADGTVEESALVTENVKDGGLVFDVKFARLDDMMGDRSDLYIILLVFAIILFLCSMVNYLWAFKTAYSLHNADKALTCNCDNDEGCGNMLKNGLCAFFCFAH